MEGQNYISTILVKCSIDEFFQAAKTSEFLLHAVLELVEVVKLLE